ncbi:MAG: hypothetical protein NDI82_14060, partial [Anaeromyxobacteraceae bacterium]|nr:hypothetical protein [Anaeromyxobacteraceae bacterium]
MRDIETRQPGGQLERGWWQERTPLEKVGAVALGVVGAVVVGAILFPHAAAATAGGAMTAGGA